MIRQKLRVLLIEDDPGDALLVKTALKEARSTSFVVMHETTLADAIERLTVSSTFDVVLLDLGLPDSESADTLPRLLAAVPPVPIVVMTGLDAPQAAEHAIELGAQDFMVKDEMDSRSLARTLQNAIHRFRSERERMTLADMLAAEYDRMAEELSAARNMQFDLLPRRSRLDRIQSTLNLAIDSYFKPSSDIGGDLWGCLEEEGGSLVVYILDFSGHGVGAALNVFRLHTLISELKGQITDPAATLHQINSALHGLLPRGQYATMALAVIDTASQTMTWSGAGAPLPVLFDKDGGSQWLDTAGTPLGLSSSALYHNRTIGFPPGSSLFLYSDAMTEAYMADGEMVEQTRLLEMVRRHYRIGAGVSIPALVEQFLDQVRSPLDDDMTVVSVTLT